MRELPSIHAEREPMAALSIEAQLEALVHQPPLAPLGGQVSLPTCDHQGGLARPLQRDLDDGATTGVARREREDQRWGRARQGDGEGVVGEMVEHDASGIELLVIREALRVGKQEQHRGVHAAMVARTSRGLR